MNDAEAERIRTRVNPDWRPDVRCAACAYPPTCPQLLDDLWDRAWRLYLEAFERGRMPMRELKCTCRMSRRVDPDVDSAKAPDHAIACEITRGRPRELLCLECVEKVIERPLTLEDLTPCMGNYAHYVMQRRRG